MNVFENEAKHGFLDVRIGWLRWLRILAVRKELDVIVDRKGSVGSGCHILYW
jgi:hypothetical protein